MAGGVLGEMGMGRGGITKTGIGPQAHSMFPFTRASHSGVIFDQPDDRLAGGTPTDLRKMSFFMGFPGTLGSPSIPQTFTPVFPFFARFPLNIDYQCVP